MSTRFFTNHGEQTLFKKFQGVFESNPDIEWFDALVGYLRASGYFAIRPYLEKVPHIRILVGINVDAIMADYHRRGLLFLADPTKVLEEFKNELRKDIQSADYTRESETGIIQFVDDVISKKIELKAHPTKRLHAKLYVFRPKGFNEHKPGAVITGSSNLSAAGIGVNEQVSNYEFNVVLHDFDDVKFAKDEFERLWDESVDILPKFLKEVRDSTYLASTVTPYELYYKLLLEYFGPSIEYDPNAITDLPEGYKRLSYQVDAVTSGFRLLKKHGGVFLADVVGLGKTMIATLVQPYDRDRWLDTLHQILPRTEIFAKPQPVAVENARAESIFQLGKIPLADIRNLALLEVVVDEDTDLPGNRAALRHLVAKYIDLAEYHGVFAIFHRPQAKDYRFTFAAGEVALDDSGQLVRTETAPRRYTYLLGPNESCRTAAERFDLLARKGADATIADVRAAFDKEPLTREFFKRFEVAIEAVKTDLEKNQALPSAQAYSRAQLLLERLLFLYFVQNRGWLDQKRNYLLDNFHSHRAIPGECTYYADFLERVFFTLSTPPDFKGPGAGIRLPGLPFLNGGLFDDEFAQTQERKKDNPPLRVRNGTMADVFENLLEAFNFTAHEDTPIDQDVAVDPEMLGKVFESIVLHAEAADPDAVAPDKRKATGSYYTPRIVVHFICRESLCQYLLPRLTESPSPTGVGEGGRRPDEGRQGKSNQTGTDWNRRLRAILDILALDGLDADELALLKTLLTPAEGRQILDLIRDLKCLDPSVGSGAFPVGLLHELVNLRRICDAAALGYVDPVRKHGNQWVHQQKAEIVENCLYGVDLQQQAIEICRLRLWLSLVVDYDLGCDPFNADEKSFRAAIRDISQLPNLEMNFRRGDSLLDMVSNVPIRVTSDLLTGRSDDVAAIQKLGHELHKARNAQKKKKLRLEILGLRLDLSQRVLADEKTLLRKGQQVGDLFGNEEGSDAEKRRRAEVEIEQLDKALAKVTSDRKVLEKLADRPMAADFYRELRKLEGADFDSPFNFVWRIDYAEIFTGKRAATTIAGDFNLGDELAPVSRAGGFDLVVGNPPFVTARNPVKRELYRERWKRVCHMKFLLVCPFFDLSFGLLKPDGQLGFIVSNAFAKREFGQPLIEDFFPTVDVQKVVDCSGLMFPGHGTPTCIVFGAQRKPDENIPIRVAAILPGGGDLRTAPEDSPVWQALAAQHDNPGFDDACVVVDDRPRKEMSRWPWSFDVGSAPTQKLLEHDRPPLLDFLAGEIGFDLVTGSDEFFVLSGDFARRTSLPRNLLRKYYTGEHIRDWSIQSETIALFPYDKKEPVELKDGLKEYAMLFKHHLESRIYFGKEPHERGMKWWEYAIVLWGKRVSPLRLAFCQISTHAHFARSDSANLFKEKSPIIKLPDSASIADYDLIGGLANSSAALFWLKQVSFSKRESDSGAKDTYFEFAGNKIDKLPIPEAISEALRGKSHSLAERISALSSGCWKRGQELPSLALRKLFEQSGEAYAAWNAALPGHVPSHPALVGRVTPCAPSSAPKERRAEDCPPYLLFETTAGLRQAFTQAIKLRENLRVEMIALQEEMDWLVYSAYGLLSADCGAASAKWVNSLTSTPHSALRIPHLSEALRPFRLWAATSGDFAGACKLIPAEWDEERQKVWTARLTEIRDNEHIRRIEQPVYKRRWDEQWKVSNSWLAGPVAYAQELVDAFRWWLVEKAEWHLEHKAKGGPLSLDAWSIALASDARVQAAWPVIAEAMAEVEAWKQQMKRGANGSEKIAHRKSPIVNSSAALIKFFRDTVNEETVPDGIPAGVAWEELKMTVPKQAKNVRGKLNVPRERFRQREDGYVWAGNSK